MPTLPPKADIRRCVSDVRPEAGHSTLQAAGPLSHRLCRKKVFCDGQHRRSV